MRRGDEFWAGQFPDLFREEYVAYADARVRYTTESIVDDLVARLHVVALTPTHEVLVCRSENEGRFLPGGTREPGESLPELAKRELLEEAGAELLGEVRCFAAHMADSGRGEPFRPHLPHPRSLWAYAVADVRLVGEPTNPADGETVVEVLALPPEEAAAHLAEHDAIHADIVRHARAMGLVPPG
jgi:8-oxo-dGTP diphosphatase